MRKIRLDVETLKAESFPTLPEMHQTERGTVFGRAWGGVMKSLLPTCNATCDTCVDTGC